MTTVVYYDEVALGRWIEEAVRKAGITVVLGAVLRDVNMDGRRVKNIDLADALRRHDDHRDRLCRRIGRRRADLAGGLCPAASRHDRQVRHADGGARKHQLRTKHPTRDRTHRRDDGEGEAVPAHAHATPVSFVIPGRGIAALNMTAHRYAARAARSRGASQLEGKDQADRARGFSRTNSRRASATRARAYGNPRHPPDPLDRRTPPAHRSTKSRNRRPSSTMPSAVPAWPVELHDTATGYVWQTFPEDHTHYVPLGSMTPGRRRQHRRRWAAASTPTSPRSPACA